MYRGAKTSVHWRHQQAHAQRPLCRQPLQSHRSNAEVCFVLRDPPSYRDYLQAGEKLHTLWELVERVSCCRSRVTAEHSCMLTQSRRNDLLMLKEPAVWLPAACSHCFPLNAFPCRVPALHAHTKQIIHLGLFSLPGISTKALLLQLMILGFEMCADIFGMVRWIRLIGIIPINIPINTQILMKCSRNKLVLWRTAWKHCTKQCGFPKLDVINNTAVVFC